MKTLVKHSLPGALAAILLALVVPIATAETGVNLLIQPFVPDKPLEFSANGYGVFGGRTDNASADYSLHILDVQGRYRLDPSLRMDPRLGVSGTFFNIDSNDPALPETLVDASLALGFHLFEHDGWVGGMTIGLGYSGVGGEAFGDGNAWYGKASFALGKKISKVDTIGFVIDYDGNRTFMPDVPLPGFAWTRVLQGQDGNKNAGPSLILTLGIPFTRIEWKPTSQLTLRGTYLIPDNISAEIDYSLTPGGPLGVFAHLESRSDAFHAEGLRHGDDRILFEQKRAEIGLRWTPKAGVNFQIAGGYAFGQEFTVGFDARDDNKLAELSDELYVRVGFEMRL